MIEQSTQAQVFFQPIFDLYCKEVDLLLKNNEAKVGTKTVFTYLKETISDQKKPLQQWLNSRSQDGSLEDRKKAINNDCKNILNEFSEITEDSLSKLVKNLFGFSIFKINERSNFISYRGIISQIVSDYVLQDIKRSARIPFGTGSIGYLTRSEQALCIWSTDADLRGTVAVEDFILGNRSFMAVPILDRERKRLLGMVACFFPVYKAFNSAEIPAESSELYKSFEKVIKRWEDVIRRFFEHESEREIVQSFRQVLAGQAQAQESISSSKWWDNILDVILPSGENDILGVSIAEVWKISSDLRVAFVSGRIDEQFVLYRYKPAMDKAALVPKWITLPQYILQGDDEIQGYVGAVESGLAARGWKEFVRLENFDDELFKPLYTRFKHLRQERKVGQSKAQTALDTYQYEQEKMQDILVPLVWNAKCHGVIRINCSVENDTLLRQLLRSVIGLEREFSMTARILSIVKESGEKFSDKKLAEELKISYANTLLAYLMNKNEIDDPVLRQFLETYAQTIISRSLAEKDAKVDTEKVSNALKSIRQGLNRFFTKPVSVMSIWLVKTKLVLRDVPTVIFGIHRPFPIDIENPPPGIGELHREFFNLPTFRVVQRLVDFACSHLNNNEPLLHTDLVTEGGIWKIGEESILFGTLLSQADAQYPQLRYLYVFQEKPNHCISLITSFDLETLLQGPNPSELWTKAKASGHLINASKGTASQLVLECVWELRDCRLDRESSYVIDGRLQSYFWDKYQNSLQLGSQVQRLKETDSIIRNFDLTKYIDDLKATQMHVIPLQADQEAADTEFLKVWRKANTLGYALAYNLEYPFLGIIPIVKEAKLQYLIYLYSAYENPKDPQVVHFKYPHNETLLKLLKEYIEEQLNREESSLRRIRESLAASFSHAYVKRATALYNTFNLFSETAIGSRASDLSRKINDVNLYFTLAPSQKLAIAYERFLRWYRNDIEVFYDALRSAEAFRANRGYEVRLGKSASNLLKVRILKNFADAMAVAAFADELQEGYYNVFEKDAIDWIFWLNQLGNISDGNLSLCDQFISDVNDRKHLRRGGSFLILKGEIQGARLKEPRIDDQNVVDVYWRFWDKVISETFLNVVGAFNDAYFRKSNIPPKIQIGLKGKPDNQMIIEFSNPTIRDNTDGEVDPPEPAMEGGRRGFGLYGNKVIINEALAIGSYRIEVRNKTYFTRIKINSDTVVTGT